MADSALLTQVGAVVFVFVLLGAAVYLLGRRGGGRLLPVFALRGRAKGQMEVVDRLYLTPHHSLHIVRIGARRLLITVHPSGCTVVESSSGDFLNRGPEDQR